MEIGQYFVGKWNGNGTRLHQLVGFGPAHRKSEGSQLCCKQETVDEAATLSCGIDAALDGETADPQCGATGDAEFVSCL